MKASPKKDNVEELLKAAEEFSAAMPRSQEEAATMMAALSPKERLELIKVVTTARDNGIDLILKVMEQENAD
jgi:hypothetical protein